MNNLKNYERSKRKQKIPIILLNKFILLTQKPSIIFITYSYSPTGREEPPRWSSALCGIGLFIYQSLDAIDGKQARRTNSSSPLGELFDHGCDSISTVFVALSACISVQLGYYPRWMFFQCFCAMTLFYCAHWQTYVSGTLRFGRIDVTEAQCTIIGIHMISAIFGPSIWMTKVRAGWELVGKVTQNPRFHFSIAVLREQFVVRFLGSASVQVERETLSPTKQKEIARHILEKVTMISPLIDWALTLAAVAVAAAAAAIY